MKTPRFIEENIFTKRGRAKRIIRKANKAIEQGDNAIEIFSNLEPKIDIKKEDVSYNSNSETEAITHEKPSKFASFMQGVGNVINKIADAENEVNSWDSERLEREKNRPHSSLVDTAVRCRLKNRNTDDEDE